MTPIAIASNIFARQSRQRTLALVRRLGFTHIDLWAAPVIAQHVDPGRDRAPDVLGELEEHALRPLMLSLYYTTDQEKVDRFRLAAAMGVPYVAFEVAPNADYLEKMSGFSLDGRTLTPPGAGWPAFTRALARYLHLAEDLGLRVALQVPHVHTLVETVEDLKRLRESVHSPALHFLVSPPHAVAGGAGPEEFLRHCEDRLAVIHLWNVRPDYRVGVDGRSWGTPAHQLAITGYLDLMPLVTWASERHGPALCVKCHGTEQWTDPEAIVRLVREATAGLPMRQPAAGPHQAGGE